MRALRILGLLALLPLGCGRNVPPAAGLGSDGPVGLTPVAVGLVDPTIEPIFEGHTPEQWAGRLSSNSPEVRAQARTALGRLDKQGYPFLVQGMKSNSSEMRLQCLQAIYKPVLVKNSNETLPLVMSMLQERDPQLRLNAVSRLPWFEKDAARAMPTLQYLAANDASPEVRQAAKESMMWINSSITGIAPSHGKH